MFTLCFSCTHIPYIHCQCFVTVNCGKFEEKRKLKLINVLFRLTFQYTWWHSLNTQHKHETESATSEEKKRKKNFYHHFHNFATLQFIYHSPSTILKDRWRQFVNILENENRMKSFQNYRVKKGEENTVKVKYIHSRIDNL